MRLTRSKLGKLGVAILEGFVGKHLGSNFVDELRGEFHEHETLIRALQKTEEIFQRKCGDKDFAHAILVDLPITTLRPLQEAVQSYYNNPADSVLPEALAEIILRDLSKFVPADVDTHIDLYITILTEQLAMLDEGFRSKISTLVHLENLAIARQTLQAVKFVATNTDTKMLDELNGTSTSSLSTYLKYVIESHHLLKLHGIYLSNEIVGIQLDKIYVPQHVLRAKSVNQEDMLLSRLGNQVPGYRKPVGEDEQVIETETISLMDQAFSQYPRLVVLGAPGTGKSTLLSYLALHHAIELQNQVRQFGELTNHSCLPVFCALRDLKRFLPENGSDGPDVLLRIIYQTISTQQIPDFRELLDRWLNDEHACCLILLDGMDEVGDEKTRARVSRIIEKFTVRYPHNRYVVTSRVAGYRLASRLGEGYKVATLHPFNESDIRKFVTNCNREIEQFLHDSPDQSGLEKADLQSEQLLETILGNPKLVELAYIPLLLMIILLVFRGRGQLPDQRVKIYAAVVEVLLSQWDEAKGMPDRQFADLPSPDRLRTLQILKQVAFNMHSQKLREMSTSQLSDLLVQQFRDLGSSPEQAKRAALSYIRLIQERTGLLQERGQGVYSFAHLSLQEFLTAAALSDRDDFIAFIQANLTDVWWHEVIKMSIVMADLPGATQLLEVIMQSAVEVELYDNLFLVGECIADIGPSQIPSAMRSLVQERLLHAMLDERLSLSRRIIAGERLSILPDPRFRGPFLLPVFVKIPAGSFKQGSDPKNPYAMENEFPPKTCETLEFYMATYPVTNAQYQRFLEANHSYPVPGSNLYPVQDWDQKRRVARAARENRPVVFVAREDADQYCCWLTKQLALDRELPYEIRKRIQDGWIIRLPTEAEWERAARGAGGYEWAWGDQYIIHHANSEEEGVGDSSPVGLFREGRGGFGVYDMSGNIFEWTQDRPALGNLGIVKGGAWSFDYTHTRCAYRFLVSADSRTSYIGFRVVFTTP